MVYEGLVLAGFGMGTVFVFLTFLVLATTLMSSIVLKFSSQDDSDSSEQIDARLLAVIGAAVHMHRQRNG